MKRLAKTAVLAFALLLFMGADNSRFETVGGKIMCTCGCDQMLLKCNHVGCPNSATMIRQLHSALAQYNNDEDVLNWFRREWGVTAVVEPSAHGFELLAWIIPFAALLLGLTIVLLVIRSWRLHPATVSKADTMLDPHLEALRARARRETEI